MFMRRSTGFTLIELMVVVAVAAILLAIALPSFQSSLRSNRVATTSNELLTSLNLARSEAIRSTRGGGVCASANGTSCGADWNTGWMVWTETNGNLSFDDGETIVKYAQAKPQIQITGSEASIAFDGRGRAAGGAAQSLGVVPDGDATIVRCLNVNMTGQARIKKEAC